MSRSSISQLQHIVPEPIELPPAKETPPKRPRWLTRILKNIQKYLAYSFLGFFGLHIASTVFAPGLGVRTPACNDLFEMCRSVYLVPLVEYTGVYAAAALHVASGVTLRLLRRPRRATKERDIIITDGHRDDIGLGGIGTVLGLGFKKSWVLTHFPAFTPLTLSGYVMAAALGFHVFKMRLAPLRVDGDSLLVTLRYVTHYLHQSYYGPAGAAANYAMLALLLWVSFYHVVSGLFKYRRQVSLRAKKIAYGIIATCTGVSFLAMTRFRLWDLETGFMGRQFAKYLFVDV